MKKLSILTLVLSASLVVKAQEYNIDATKIALSGYSPVSYVDLNLAQRGLKEFKTEHEGLKYYFTSMDQKATFDKNPSRYLPQFGGWCATGIAVGAKFRSDPNKFLVDNGKLYVFLNDLEVDAKQLWIADPKEMRKNAEKNWPELKGK
ncbi:MAG: YHS domain-containing (seleno)protein [Cyclobacteriaceae bacterium]